MKEAMLWNKDRTESVRASKIRNFGIYQEQLTLQRRGWKLLGWYNSNEYFYFGYFETEEETRRFLDEIHKQIEGVAEGGRQRER